MEITPLGIAGCFLVRSRGVPDDRGRFLEWFKDSAFRAATGRALDLRQANLSVSRAGVIRGIHFTDVPPGQAKYVTCPSGRILDVVVDLRVGSPTFGHWDSVELNGEENRALFLAEGLGHAFLSLRDDSVVAYLCNAEYGPGRDHEINPFDPQIGIEWPAADAAGAPLDPVTSPKDREAPTLAEAKEAGMLPDFQVCQGLAG